MGLISMSLEAKLSLSKQRLISSKEDLDTAKELLELGRFKAFANRSYYSMFHAMRSILALDSVDFKKHSGVISFFRERYIKTKTFDAFFSDSIQVATDLRNESDYGDFVLVERIDAEDIYNAAKVFYFAVGEYLETRWLSYP